MSVITESHMIVGLFISSVKVEIDDLDEFVLKNNLDIITTDFEPLGNIIIGKIIDNIKEKDFDVRIRELKMTFSDVHEKLGASPILMSAKDVY